MVSEDVNSVIPGAHSQKVTTTTPILQDLTKNLEKKNDETKKHHQVIQSPHFSR